MTYPCNPVRRNMDRILETWGCVMQTLLLSRITAHHSPYLLSRGFQEIRVVMTFSLRGPLNYL